MFDRWYAAELKASLERPYVQLVFGARQTGKTTLLNALLPPETLRVDLANPEERSRHLADPGFLLKLCRDLPADREGRFVFVDEAQAVPTVFDAVQHLYDNDKLRWRFVLCCSSAQAEEDGRESASGPVLLPSAFPVDDGRAPAGAEAN